jgi:hypothetical protein
MWKERLWQVFLVAILGLSLTMCSRTGSNNNTPVANAGLTEISGTMTCLNVDTSTAAGWTYYNCDASDDTTLATISSSGNNYTNSITHDAAFAAGWKLVGPSCSTGYTGARCFLFHK